MRRLLSSAFILAVAGGTGALAQGAAKIEPAAGEAKLMAVVGDGIFELRQGKFIDLTKNQWLLMFNREQQANNLERGQIYIKLAGQDWNLTVGNRVDLKNFNATSKDAKDKDKCYLELIDVVTPKGAPATATFRFNCL